MSDNTHPEIVELRHRVLELENLNAALLRRCERSVDPLAVDECFRPPHVTIGINDPITIRRRVVSWFKKVHGVEPQDY